MPHASPSQSLGAADHGPPARRPFGFIDTSDDFFWGQGFGIAPPVAVALGPPVPVPEGDDAVRPHASPTAEGDDISCAQFTQRDSPHPQAIAGCQRAAHAGTLSGSGQTAIVDLPVHDVHQCLR